MEQGFTYEAQWQVAATASRSAAAAPLLARKALLLQLTAPDGARTLLGMTAGTTGAKTLVQLSADQPVELRLATLNKTTRRCCRSLIGDRAGGQWAAAGEAPCLAAHALQALQHFAVDATGSGGGSGAALASVSLSSCSEGSPSAVPHG